MRIRLEGVPQRYHEDHIRRGMKVEDGFLSSQEFGVETKLLKYKGRIRL